MLEFLKSKIGCDAIEKMVESCQIEVKKWQKLKKLSCSKKGNLYIWLLHGDYDDIKLLPINEQILAYIAKANYIGIDSSRHFSRFFDHMHTHVSPYDRFLRKSLLNDAHLMCIYFKKRSNLYKVFETISVHMFRNMSFTEILNVNGKVMLSEKIAKYDTNEFYLVLVWLMYEAVKHPIRIMRTTHQHSDAARKRVAREQMKSLAEYNDFIAKLMQQLKENGGEIACEKCLFGLDQYQTKVYMNGLIETGVIRIVGKYIKLTAIVDEKNALNEENALVDKEVDQ